jgi:CheY-like chemotaxis protein
MHNSNTGRVLAIDDDPGIRNVLKRIFETGGYDAEIVSSGQEALALLFSTDNDTDACPFGLILTDLGMPEMDGWSVATAIRSRWLDVPVVLVTGWGDDVDNKKSKECQINEVISKPFNLHNLLELISKYTTH